MANEADRIASAAHLAEDQLNAAERVLSQRYGNDSAVVTAERTIALAQVIAINMASTNRAGSENAAELPPRFNAPRR